jgi:hypothetical protein
MARQMPSRFRRPPVRERWQGMVGPTAGRGLARRAGRWPCPRYEDTPELRFAAAQSLFEESLKKAWEGVFLHRSGAMAGAYLKFPPQPSLLNAEEPMGLKERDPFDRLRLPPLAFVEWPTGFRCTKLSPMREAMRRLGAVAGAFTALCAVCGCGTNLSQETVPVTTSTPVLPPSTLTGPGIVPCPAASCCKTARRGRRRARN